MNIMCDNAPFVEKIEVTDHDIAGEHHTLMNHVTLAERDNIAVNLNRWVDQIRK